MCNISSSSFLKLPDNTDVATLLVVWSTGGAGRTTGKPAICQTWHRSPGSWCYRGWTSADRTPPLLSTSGLLQNWCCKVKKWPVNITPWFWSITMFIKADKLNISSLDQNIMHFSWSKVNTCKCKCRSMNNQVIFQVQSRAFTWEYCPFLVNH